MPRPTFLQTLRRLLRGRPAVPRSSATHAELKRTFDAHPSFTDLLSFVDFDSEQGVFVMEDGRNCGVLFEVTPVPTESRTPADLEDIARALWMAVKDALPEDPDAPWILQCYASNERNLFQVMSVLEDYIRTLHPELLDTEFTKTWLEIQRAHLKQVAQPHGIFLDHEINNGAAWRGKNMRQRITLYRSQPGAKSFGEQARDANQAADALRAALAQAGVRVRRCSATDLYEWLLPWFSPATASAGGDPYEFLRQSPIVDSSRPHTYGEEREPVLRGAELLAGYDLGNAVVTGEVRSDAKNNAWWFDDLPHRVLTLQQITRSPTPGHLTGERIINSATTTLLDTLPEGTTMVTTIVIQPQYQIQGHLEMMLARSLAPTAEAAAAQAEAQAAKQQLTTGNKLFPMLVSAYLRGDTIEQLDANTINLVAILRTNGLRMIELAHDLFSIHQYTQQLPFAYRFHLDKTRTNRSRLTYSTQIAKLLPVYGRARGTGKPGMIFFNRGAEPVMVDPIQDRQKNAHLLVFGPTGSGKSAWLTGTALHLMAVHRPRLFIIDPSASFGPLGEYFRAQGLSVNYLRLGASGVTLNPYADALKLLELPDHEAAEDEGTWDDDAVERDLLGEMELITLTMVTGGDAVELNQIRRGERALLRDVVRDATRHVHAENKAAAAAGGKLRQVVPSDVLAAFRRREGKETGLKTMADAFSYFCGQDSFTGRLFDTQGTPFPEADVTIVEFGKLTQGERQAEQTVALMALMNEIHHVVEKHANDRRPTVILQDEGHIVTKNRTLSPYVIKIVKLWRKLGAWYWFVTQDLEDVSEAAKPLLNNLEWLVGLQMGNKEVEDLAAFRNLTEQDKTLLRSPRKQPGDYSEGVIIRGDLKLLFRSVLPPLALALAGTEKEERVRRLELMRERGLPSLLEANLAVAAEIAEKRAGATRKRSARAW